MNRQSLINTIKQNFMLKRLRAQEENDAFISALRKDPDFDGLYKEYTAKQLEYAKTKFIEEDVALRHACEDLRQQMESYLTNHKMDKSLLYPQYSCKICNDTGVVGGRICSCFLGELNKKISTMTSSQTSFKSFDVCDNSIMNEDDKKACKWLKTWCLTYPNTTKTNINILGGAGTGKTFFLECIANEMIAKNLSVCFKTAFELNELARLYHIGKSYEFGDILKVDILLIDDLGTEPILNNVTKEYLYNLINVRQINHLPTIISTNLSLDNILSRYDERIFSRLANKNLSTNIILTSQDKRLNN